MPDLGIGEALAAALVSAGVGAETAAAAAPFIVGGLEGAGIGAAGAGVTGGDPGIGALTGGLTGGVVGGFGAPIGSALGIGTFGGDVLAGAGAGALGAGITGGDPLTGTLSGAGSGALSGAISEFGAPTSAPGATSAPGTIGGPGPSAPGAAAPSGLGGGTGPFVDELSSFTTPGPGASGATAPGATGGNLGFGDSVSGFGAPVSGALAGMGPGAGSELAPIDSAAFGAHQDLVSPAVNSIGASVTDPAATSGVSGTPGNDLPVPPVPPYPLDASGISTAPPGAPPLASQTPGTWTPGVNDAAGTSTIKPPGVLDGLFGPGTSVGKAISDPSVGTIGNALASNANWLVPAAIGGYEALSSNKGLEGVPGYAGLTGTADRLSAQSTQLQSYLEKGTLPPGVAQSLKQASTAAKAAIRGQYAARGMSGSSSEQTDLANVDNTVISQGANIATNLLTTGVNEANLSAQLYSQILNASLSEDQHLGSALATLASSAARPTINVKAA